MNTEYTEESRSFYREMPDYDFGMQRACIHSPKAPAEDTGIRLYCTQFQQAWSLQIRGFFQTRNYEKGSKWYYADAKLNIDDLRTLRDACDSALNEIEAQ